MTDHRDLAALRGHWYEHLDIHRLRATFTRQYVDDEGYCCEETSEVKFRFEICETCEGKGTHVNPSIDSHGLSREDFEDDPDFMEDYMRGRYDVTCYECGGLGRVPVPDPDDPEYDHVQAERARRTMAAHERAHELECGY